MHISKEEIRKRLQAKAEEVIEAYMDWEEENPRPDLLQIEEVVLRLRKEFGRELTQVAVEAHPMCTPVPGPKCSQCGREMSYKGQKTTQVESQTGNVQVKRGYYYCPQCKTGFFPLG